MNKFSIMLFVCFIQATEYSGAHLLLPARLRSLSKERSTQTNEMGPGAATL